MDGWNQTGDEDLHLSCPFSTIDPYMSVYLRPEDEIEIGQFRIMIKRDNLERAIHAGEIQVKSSGQTDIGLGNGEQQIKNEILESQTIADLPTSTPDPRLCHNSRTIETVIETPAASSRHQQPPINLSPIISSVAENAIKGKEDSQLWGSDPNNREIMSKLRSVAEPRARSSSSTRSTESKNGKESPTLIKTDTEAGQTVVNLYSESQDESSGSAVVPGEMINNFHADLQKTSPMPPGFSNGDTQNSTRDRGDLLLRAAAGSQERLSNQRPSSPVAEHSTYDHHVSNSNSPVQGISLSSLKPPRNASNKTPVRNGHKRKRDNDDSQGSMKSTIHVVIPTATHTSDSKSSSKKQKMKSTTPAQGVDGALAKRPKYNSTTPIADARLKSDTTQTTESSRESIDPSSSSLSTRSSSVNIGARILYASSTIVDKQTRLMSFLTKQKVKKASSIHECNFLCVGKGELKKTGNLVMAVVLGKPVITDEWVVQSVAQGELLDFDKFLARDAVREAEWGINLDQAIQRGKDGVKPLAGLSFYFSPTAKKELGRGYAELKDIATLAGAASVHGTLPKKSNNGLGLAAASVVIVAAENDRDLPTLGAGGWRCFSKDIVTVSVLRGGLNLESEEFLIGKGGMGGG